MSLPFALSPFLPPSQPHIRNSTSGCTGQLGVRNGNENWTRIEAVRISLGKGRNRSIRGKRGDQAALVWSLQVHSPSRGRDWQEPGSTLQGHLRSQPGLLYPSLCFASLRFFLPHPSPAFISHVQSAHMCQAHTSCSGSPGISDHCTAYLRASGQPESGQPGPGPGALVGSASPSGTHCPHCIDFHSCWAQSSYCFGCISFPFQSRSPPQQCCWWPLNRGSFYWSTQTCRATPWGWDPGNAGKNK